MKIAGVVVTYNRKEELVKNIKAILSQSMIVDKYFIIDNHGTDNTKQLLEENGLLDNKVIEYVYLDENIGGAGGFYTGLKMAYDNGYDFICLMDDDGRPADKKMMENLMDAAVKLYLQNKLIFINSLVVSFDNENLSFGLSEKIKTKEEALNQCDENGYILNKVNPFNGTLVSKELVDTIGFPNKDFFIKGDEADYLRRARKANALIVTVTKSKYKHPFLEQKYMNFFGKKIQASTESPWKEYYRARNYTYMLKRDNESIKYIKQNIRQIICAIRFNSQKIKTIKMIIKGCNDGRKGKLGPTVKP